MAIVGVLNFVFPPGSFPMLGTIILSNFHKVKDLKPAQIYCPSDLVYDGVATIAHSKVGED